MIYLNGHELHFKEFPNGETLVDGEELQKATKLQDGNMIKFKYKNDGDLIKLMFVKRHLDSRGHKNTRLYITYMPYSRMDRVEGLSVFTLKYVSEFINSLNFGSITVYEVHSDVSVALLNDCVDIHLTVSILLNKVIEEVKFNKEKDYIYFPDSGASKRYGKMLKGYKELVGYKKRDFTTGEITDLQILGAETLDHGSPKVIMIDDLCSYGTTFFKGAEKLVGMGAGEIYLIVGHAENSIVQGSMIKANIIDKNGDGRPLVNKIYTTDSILTETHPKIKVFKV